MWSPRSSPKTPVIMPFNGSGHTSPVALAEPGSRMMRRRAWLGLELWPAGSRRTSLPLLASCGTLTSTEPGVWAEGTTPMLSVLPAAPTKSDLADAVEMAAADAQHPLLLDADPTGLRDPGGLGATRLALEGGDRRRLVELRAAVDGWDVGSAAGRGRGARRGGKRARRDRGHGRQRSRVLQLARIRAYHRSISLSRAYGVS